MRLPVVLCSLVLTASLSAQLARDDWVVSTFNDFIGNTAIGGLWHVDAAQTTATLLANQTANMPGANAVAADENGLVFYGTIRTASIAIPNPCEIFQVLITAGSITSETQLTTGPIDGGSVSGLVLRRNQIWFVTDAGNVGWIPKTGGAPTIVLNLQSNGVLGLGQSITTNGREIFVGTSHTNTTPDPANVWSFDAESALPTLTPLAFFAGSAFALDLARDGKVLVGRISGRLYLVDPLVPNQTAVQINVGATAPQSNCNGTAINAWTNVVGNVAGYGGAVVRVAAFYDVATNTWGAQLPMNTSVPSGVASATEEPFFAFGRGCAGTNALEPRIGWNGMPIQGQSFNLTLRNADPVPGIAFLFLGLSDTVGPLGPLPYDLGSLGAPGCSELVALDVSILSLLQNGSGSAAVPIPVNPSAAGLRFFAQWASISIVNTLGIATSDAVAIQVR
jgi:hypothetical protein